MLLRGAFLCIVFLTCEIKIVSAVSSVGNYTADERCAKTDDCLNNLVCYEATCKCLSQSHQKVSSDRKSCTSKVKGRCKTSSECVSNSICKLNSDSRKGYCQCKEGYVAGRTGECEGNHGQYCDYNVDACDKVANLVCIDHKCSCNDPLMYKYSENQRKCLGLVSADCEGLSSCIPNAQCQAEFEDANTIRRMCKCRKGYQETGNFTCELAPPPKIHGREFDFN